MPIYKTDAGLIYFSHVPKCAGTSVTGYLEARFGAPAFEDRAYFRDAAAYPWTHTSPQHVTIEARDRLFPPSFFDFEFAVVRNPIKRLASVYGFQKRNQKTIGRFTSFSGWLKRLPKVIEDAPYTFDGHALPQTKFVSDEATVFRLEDGLEAVERFLDDSFGAYAGTLEFGHAKKAKKPVRVSASDEALIREIYRADFERFGYD